ncbi:hypothetical protein ANN_12604 [Periplaneta americana]|uniref:DUF659 domain-containing protein n=1 Tax=Periplaneta americana TaxID=6978 RepID=A0ABQ8TGZ7_PERAM|nr:hypothetical protein ANN_12604 [Periplaneta americana]
MGGSCERRKLSISSCSHYSNYIDRVIVENLPLGVSAVCASGLMTWKFSPGEGVDNFTSSICLTSMYFNSVPQNATSEKKSVSSKATWLKYLPWKSAHRSGGSGGHDGAASGSKGHKGKKRRLSLQPSPAYMQTSKEYWMEYCRNTSLHGLQYVGEQNRPMSERYYHSLLYFCNSVVIVLVIEVDRRRGGKGVNGGCNRNSNSLNKIYAYEVIVLYGCEYSTLTLREERRLRVFENKILRKIFGAKRDEITGERRKLHNAELHALYSSPDIIRNIKSRRLRWAGHVARMGESRNAYSVLVGRPEGKRPLWRPRRRWEDNIKMYLREVGYDDRDWINLAQDRDRWWTYVRAAMNLRCAVSSTQKFLVQQHITTSKHQANKQLNSKQRQLFLTQPTTSNVRSEFNIDLCRSLISADIPLYKLKNKVFREFLEKYTQHTIPDESTLRKTYAPSIYDETIQKIRDEIKDSSIWVSIDETPDKEGRLVGNVVIGLLSEQYSERILLHCDVLEKCNNKTIVKLFNEAMGILWPKGIMYDNVLFFISDAALICEKVFLKAPSRVNVLKEMYPEIPLPPKPILTRWGTWLEAVEYYAEHIDSINNVLLALDSEDAVSIDTAKTVTCDISVKRMT